MDYEFDDADRPRRQVRKEAPPPKKMTKSRIANICQYYLSQRDATSGMIRQMLSRRATAWLKTLADEELEAQRAEFQTHVEDVIKSLQDAGVVNDVRYGEAKARSMRWSGKSATKIRMELGKKGLEDEAIETALARANDDLDVQGFPPASHEDMPDPEFLAAQILARKKKIGPWRKAQAPSDKDQVQKLWRREAGVLARAGFSFGVIKSVLSAEVDPTDPLSDFD